MGFTPTDPWSTQFEYLSYDSVNFIEGMGSILVFIWVGMIWAIMLAIVHLFRINCSC